MWFRKKKIKITKLSIPQAVQEDIHKNYVSDIEQQNLQFRLEINRLYAELETLKQERTK